MRLRVLLFCLSGFLWLACSDDPAETREEEDLTLSKNNLSLSGEQEVAKIVISSNTAWKITGEADWLTFNKTNGNGNDTLTITVEANFDVKLRSADFYVESEEISERLMIKQDVYVYRIPVIFHVMYADASDTLQYLKTERIREMVEGANAIYRNRKGNTTDILVELVPAETTPDGKFLPEAGIERILWPQDGMDEHEFIRSDNPEYIKLLWDLKSYINVFIFTFKEDGKLATNTGVASLPYTTSDTPLDGLTNGDYYVMNPDARPDYVHSVVINNRYAYSDLPGFDMIKTFAHEVGHYLGLRHVFSESDCSGTDYCDDTPNYNRAAYETWFGMHSGEDYSVTSKRTSCDGGTFESTNLMDYFVGSREEITPDQFKRIRHSLVHSPLLPGPKMPYHLSKCMESDVKPIPGELVD